MNRNIDDELTDDFAMGSHDFGTITREDVSTYHSAFGKHSFKTVAEGQMDDDLYANLNENSHYFSGFLIIMAIFAIMWTKNAYNIKDRLRDMVSEEKRMF